METARTISCKLATVPQQKQHIEQTLQAFADACNFVSRFGQEQGVWQQFALHQACYQYIREKYKLPANLAIRTIARVAVDLKERKQPHRPFQPNIIAFDTRVFSLKETDWTVGLTLINGREKFHLDVGKHQKKVLKGKKPLSAMLCKKNRSYYLEIQIDDR